MCLSDCHVSRRTVLAGLASLATSSITRAASVDTITEHYRYDRSGSTIEAFFARPRTGRVRSLVAVTHGNWGIPEDVRDASRLLAANGFAALAVNPTSREPDHTVIPKSMLEGREFGDRYIADIREGVRRLRAEDRAPGGSIAIWGYCGGGYVGLLWAASAAGSELGALVGAHVALRNRRGDGSLFATRPHGIDLARESSVPISFHFGGEDPLTPAADISDLAAMASQTRDIETFVYPGASHGFAMHTDTGYAAAAAAKFQERGLAFLAKRL